MQQEDVGVEVPVWQRAGMSQEFASNIGDLNRLVSVKNNAKK